MLVAMSISTAHAARPLPAPDVIAVYAYAEWCPNCKLISPALEKARKDGTFDTRNVLFVTLDLSDKARIHQSILHAQALGLGPYLQKQGSAVGYVALLDARTKTEIARFDRTADAAHIVSMLQEALASNRAP
ncbi:MAG: hypothetical protein C0436_04235 [Alphaproteobacteria bacterium]|nr:hypothetical protein [Alphaproteobacteria bacterium]